MTAGYVLFEYPNELLDDGVPEMLALMIEDRLSEYCRANGLTRLEGPAHRRQDSPRWFVTDSSALVWPAEFPDET